MEQFLIARTGDAKDLPLPRLMTEGAAGMDLYANVQEETVLPAGEILLIPTGVKIALPRGYEAQIRPRSGLALKNGITLVNSPGTIDSDYRGEIKLIMINHGKKEFAICRGDRIGQMVICKLPLIEWNEVEEAELSDTQRGKGGFGHTGTGQKVIF